MKLRGDKFIALLIVFSLIMLSVNLYAKEKRGAKLSIFKKDGQKIKGELIAVKKDSLLLLESESGADVSVYVKDIIEIRTVKKAPVKKGLIYGLIIGVIRGGTLCCGYSLGVRWRKKWSCTRIISSRRCCANWSRNYFGGCEGYRRKICHYSDD
ncbi:MAG: hypothetical protein E3J56_02085 [Candidatus Aminicenantes bacterium]|nr:MAG: hypothetical protein E3J56_02085 [Candidatus Aminicenantes bacterium]